MDRGEQEEHEDTKGHMMKGLVHTLSHFAVHSFEHEKWFLSQVQDLKCSNFLQTYAIDLIFFSMDRGDEGGHGDIKGPMMQGLGHTLSHLPVHRSEHEKCSVASARLLVC